jgi:hypothetical protein
MSAAEHFISYFLAGTNVAHDYLLTLGHHFPSDGARIMCSPRATPTERLNLQGIDSVGELDQTTRTRKKLGSKVGEDSKGVYIDSESIHNSRQLFDLLWLIELRLITDDVINPLTD